VQHNGTIQRVDRQQLLALHRTAGARVDRAGLERDDFVFRRFELQHTELAQFGNQHQKVALGTRSAETDTWQRWRHEQERQEEEKHCHHSKGKLGEIRRDAKEGGEFTFYTRSFSNK
jgi:hypothetical protein